MMKANKWATIDKEAIDLVKCFLHENKTEINTGTRGSYKNQVPLAHL